MRAVNYFVTALVVCALTGSASGQDAMPWAANLPTAKRVASQQSQLVLIHFWRPNCPPCRTLERNVFQNPSFGQAILANYVPVKVNLRDSPATGRQYGVDRTPTDVIITPAGYMVHKMVSPQDPWKYVTQLNRVAARGKQAMQSMANGDGPTPPPSGLHPVHATDHYAGAARSETTARDPGSWQNPTNSAARDRPFDAGGRYAASFDGPPAGYQAYGSSRFNSRRPSAPQGGALQVGVDPPGTVQNNTFVRQDYRNSVQDQRGAPPYRGESQAPPSRSRWADSQRNEPIAGGFQPNGRDDLARRPAREDVRNRPSWATETNSPPQSGPGGFGPSQTLTGNRNWAPSDKAGAGKFASGPLTPPKTKPQPDPGNSQLGLEGYCPVSLIDKADWRKGDPRWGAVHRGRTYLFGSLEHQQRFMANPDVYSPVLSGYDPVKFSDEGLLVPGKRQHGLFYGRQGKQIYLFSEEQSLQRFLGAKDHYVDAVRQAMRQDAGRGRTR